MDLPPLNSLRAFEAAARHRSFAAAAEELHVSAGAVSRHVKQLEAHLGADLFERRPQGVRLTPAGERLQPDITAAFDTIARAAGAARAAPLSLRVLASPTITNRWLIPRLHGFRERHPGVTISFGVLRQSHAELADGGFDVAVATFGSPPAWPRGLSAELLRDEELTPLASPVLCGRSRLVTPGDLADQTLLRIEPCLDDWPRWLAANDCADVVDASRGPSYETGEMALKAASEGLGVALMDRLLAADELESGEIVDVFPESKPVSNGYWFFCQEKRAADPLIDDFRIWILGEMAAG